MKKSVDLIPNWELLFGARDKNVKALCSSLNITVTPRDTSIEIAGASKGVRRAQKIFLEFEQLGLEAVQSGKKLEDYDFETIIKAVLAGPDVSLLKVAGSSKKPGLGRLKQIQPKNDNQRIYMDAISNNDMVFGIGPAGTGKTYLAMAMAVSALVQKKVARIVMVRPAVEAGERLGFLPGTMQEKVDPYMRPLYDALYDMMKPEDVDRHLAKGVLEVAPLAFMRGRTLSDAFVIMDEAQNTTSEQMKMFLTRIGFNSKAVITGDITQIDLPKNTQSGLVEALSVLKAVEGLYFHTFQEGDVVRHQLVQRIVHAYDAHKSSVFVTGMTAMPESFLPRVPYMPVGEIVGNGSSVPLDLTGTVIPPVHLETTRFPLVMSHYPGCQALVGNSGSGCTCASLAPPDLRPTRVHYPDCPAFHSTGGTCVCTRLARQ